MADINQPAVGEDDCKIASSGSPGAVKHDSSEIISSNRKGKHENGNVVTQDKCLESKRNTEERPGIMSGMPAINLNELTNILRDPSMPSHKIMNEVADKLTNEESESDDGCGGMVGMKNLLDCIFEVTYRHTRSDNSDDEEDESFQRIPREIPCNFCDKVFGSTMTWKTHVLVAHQDPSVLNIRRLPTNDADRKLKDHLPHRKHSRGTSKSDTDLKDSKACHPPKKGNILTTESLHSDENVPVGQKKLSIFLRILQQSETSRGLPSVTYKVEDESLPTRKGPNPDVVSGEAAEDLVISTSERKADQRVAIDSIEISEAIPKEICQDELDKTAVLHSKGNAGLQGHEQLLQANSSSQIMKNIPLKHVEDSSTPAESRTNEIELGDDGVERKKRRATSPLPDSLLSSSSLPASSSPSNPKRSRKHAAKEPASGSMEKHNPE